MKFKVGDEIRGIKGAPYRITDADMTRGRVEQTYSDGGIRVCILEHADKVEVGLTYYVNSEYFKLITPTESIHITRDGDTVHAIHKRNGEIVKRTKAVCDPRDEFEFGEGAKRAFARVLGIKTFTDGTTVSDKPEPIKFNFEDFKAGKFAVHCPTEQEAEMFLSYLHGRGVRWRGGDTLMHKNMWGDYHAHTAYRPLADGLAYGPITHYSREYIPVIPFCKTDL